MRILLASVTNAPPEILREHLNSVQNLSLPERVTLDLAYISDNLTPEALEMLSDAGASVADALPKPDDARYAVSEVGHDWALPTFGWLAREKQRLLDHAREGRYDGIFFVDSDLVLGEETLASLIYAQKDVVSAVFWTRWTPEAPPLPQVWMRHPYEFDGRGMEAAEFLRSLDERGLLQVGGLGACTLIRERVFERVAWFPLVDGLPSGGMWQGEDRHFCVRAARNHVEMWADAWPEIFHIYRPSDLGKLEEWRETRPLPVEGRPEVGDLVSLALEAVEEKELSARRTHVRGRLGSLSLLPEIEDALSEMRVGDVRVVRVFFPLWWEIEAYRGKEKNVLVRLLGAKREPSE